MKKASNGRWKRDSHPGPARRHANSESVRTTLYLARHCDVANPRGVLYGHLPNFGLSTKGKLQAEAQGSFLAKTRARAMYVSPLQRAQETARIISSHFDDIPTETTDELVEARFGHYLQGARLRDVRWQRPLWLLHKAWPGLLPLDESIRDMAARTNAPLARLRRDFPREGGICIGHGDPIQAFWNEARGMGRFLHLECAKGGILQLDYDDEDLVTIKYHSPECLQDIAAT